jgi:hypothetical protein
MELSAFDCNIESGRILLIFKVALTIGARISVSQEGLPISFRHEKNKIKATADKSIVLFILRLDAIDKV